MHIVLIVCNLGAQCFRHLACFFCVLPVFHDKQVVFQVVVDGANPFFILFSPDSMQTAVEAVRSASCPAVPALGDTWCFSHIEMS